MTKNSRCVFYIPEIAQILGIGKAKAYLLAKENKLPVLKFGNRYVVPQKPFMDWLNGTNN